LAYKILIVVSIGFAAVLFINAFKFRTKFILIGTGVWVGAIVLLTSLLPLTVQKLVVKPNELTKESPYIAHNIKYTREAYNLNKIKEIDFEVSDKLSG